MANGAARGIHKGIRQAKTGGHGFAAGKNLVEMRLPHCSEVWQKNLP